MKVDVAKDGAAVFRIGFSDWIKAIVVLGACFYGHAKLQCSKIEEVSASLQAVNTRVSVTEQGLNDLKADYKDTAKELRASIVSLNEYLRNKNAAPK
jgi:hypothetical protein